MRARGERPRSLVQQLRGGTPAAEGVSHSVSPPPRARLQCGGLLQPDAGGSAPLQRVLQSAHIQALPDAVCWDARVQHLQVTGVKGTPTSKPRMGTQSPA